jgi:hypothetical protein
MASKQFVVAMYRPGFGGSLAFDGLVAGCGRNRGTWDTAANSKRTAQRWANEVRAKYPEYIIKVESAS